jgi:hypothetical protein
MKVNELHKLHRHLQLTLSLYQQFIKYSHYVQVSTSRIYRQVHFKSQVSSVAVKVSYAFF